MRDVIAKDLWDAQQSAHAQVIDLQTGKEAATQIGLAAADGQPVHGGQRREGPHSRGDGRVPRHRRCASRPTFWRRSRSWRRSAWYLHHTPEGRYYFDRQENLTKLLQSLAHDAPRTRWTT